MFMWSTYMKFPYIVIFPMTKVLIFYDHIYDVPLFYNNSEADCLPCLPVLYYKTCELWQFNFLA